MKRGTLVLTVVAGILVFLAVLVLYLPASWFARFLPPQVRCAQLGGSIWQGECLGLVVNGGRIGDATWNLAPGRAFTGRLVGDVDVRGGAVTVRADVDVDYGGAGQLRNVTLQLPLDPAVIPQLPQSQRGQVSAQFDRLVLAAGGMPREALGVVELRDFRQVAPQPAQLGSYRLQFDGSTQPDGSLVGKLTDLGGPFLAEGTFTLRPTREYLVQGRIAGRGAEAEAIVRQITFGAPPDASGRTAFSFEGSF